MNLAAVIARLRSAKGFAHKQDIAPVLARLNIDGGSDIAVGDDCAAIPDGENFLLLAIEGFMPEFLAADPYFAGYCGVMVNLSDIAAMGGRAIAVVDAIWAKNFESASEILSGIKTASERYGVPVVGGHTNTRAATNILSVAILGRAGTNLLTSFAAQAGQNLIAAIDLRGAMRASGLYWDASTSADRATLRGDLEILPEIAEAKICAAAKDISMAGVIGTVLMLLEASNLGATVELAKIPRPATVKPEDWLLAFPSYGYILSVAQENTVAVLSRFESRGIAAAVIGTTDASRDFTLQDGGEKILFWQFAAEKLIGCTA
jgi:AIR synthase-related protein